MPKNPFIKWFIKHKAFLSQPQASMFWDERIIGLDLQESIVQSKKAQALYGYIESKIAHDYAKLIDFKLKEAFSCLDYSDFDDPSGFATDKKASFAVKNFFKVRQSVEFFIKEDISQHSDRNAQRSAFHRWIMIAQILFKRHCYEGAMLVICLLQVESSINRSKELPSVFQENYHYLCELISVVDNHKILRDKIAAERRPGDFIPVFLLIKDLASLNEVIGSQRKLQKASEFQANQKEELLESIIKFIVLCNQHRKENNLPSYLEANYQRAEAKHEASLDHEADAFVDRVEKDKTLPNLYSDGLLPLFWQRGCSEDLYWRKLLDVPPSPKLS